jgi:uncharacterized protein DUF559
VFIDAAVPSTALQPVIAASRAVGERGLASNELALWLWDMLERRDAPLEFCVLARHSARLPGITIHRMTELPPAFLRRKVWTTSPLRALVDTGRSAPKQVPGALLRGLLSGLITPKGVLAEIARDPSRRGVDVVRGALKDLGIGRFTPSQLEVHARRLFRAAGLPDPELEVLFGDHGEYRLDFFWPEAALVVEVDGWSIHAEPRARRRDYRKQNRIVISGRWILRYDWHDVVRDHDRTANEIVEAYRCRTELLGSDR